MSDLAHQLLASSGFHPHGYCYLWKPGLIWLHVVSDGLIGVAYIAIGAALAYFVRSGRGDVPFSRMFVAFGVFIAACGATHFVEIWTLWQPVYWFAGGVKVVTALASVFTAIALPPLVPVALGTTRAAKLSEGRRLELEAANAELKTLYAKLQEANEAKTRFFANASHELRTPLALILGPTETLLKADNLPEADRQRVETVQRNAGLLLTHVNDLLDLAKFDAGQMEARYARANLARIVSVAAYHFESLAQERGITYTVQTPQALPAEVDAGKIERIVFNLLGNAFKFTPAGGRIRCILDTREHAGELCATLAVHDSGPGIAPDQREIVFEPFRQGDDSAQRAGGTGLGLAIVKEFAELHGGMVAVGDSPDGGALFSVLLALRAPAGSVVAAERIAPAALNTESPPPALEAPVAEPSTGESTRPCVLVVEDNPDMNRLIADTLAPGYEVVHALDGEQGLEMALRLRPDLILSDIMMPKMSGAALVQEIRRHPELQGVPIILLSALANDQSRVRLLREGAQDYLTKPFSVEELRARVRNWINVKRAEDILRREMESTVGDVETLAREVAARKRELETALEAARLAAAEAESANQAKSEFLAVMSHELRTPLTAIVGYTELIKDGIGGEVSPAQKDMLDRTTQSSNHLLGLIEQILEHARVEAGREVINPQAVQIASLVRETADLIEPLAREKALSFVVDTEQAPAEILTDCSKLRQILVNLLGNAVKFTHQGGVALQVRSQGSDVVFAVRDTGIGISPEEREKIWEPFWQVKQGYTREAGGTGLGLSVTRQLARLLGGDVSVESTPGAGSTFTLRLPDRLPGYAPAANVSQESGLPEANPR